MNILKKSITQLENNDWGEPPSELAVSLKRCYELRHKKLEKFEIEDMRLLIGYGIGLKFLMPMAINLLEKNPLAKGQHYLGDLLVNVLRANGEYYEINPNMRQRVVNIILNISTVLKNIDSIDFECTTEALSEALWMFDKSFDRTQLPWIY